MTTIQTGHMALGDELVADELRPKFKALFHARFADQSEDIFFHLRTHYVTRERHYHTLEHIKACIDVLDSSDIKAGTHAEVLPLDSGLLSPSTHFFLTAGHFRLAKLALFYHDVIYNVRRRDNEEQSIRIFDITAGPLCSREERKIVSDAILATAHGAAEAPLSAVSSLVVDADLSILGESPETYDAYVEKIQKEYIHVSADDWRVGRAAVLHRFLNTRPIYKYSAMSKRYETQARANLERELRSLG